MYSMKFTCTKGMCEHIMETKDITAQLDEVIRDWNIYLIYGSLHP